MADFFAGAQLVGFSFFQLRNKNVKKENTMCCIWSGCKKCDLKTTRRWRAEQHKTQGLFAFSAKIWVLSCGDWSVTFLHNENVYLIHKQ